MMYLIGGPPRCGKTTVARALAPRLGCSWVPIDYLESVVYHYLPERERAEALPLLEGGYDTIYATYAPDQIIEHYRRRARTMWPAIQIFLHFALAQDQDFILEGFHIEPALMQAFTRPGEWPGASAAATSAHIAEMVTCGTAYALSHAHDERIKVSFLYREDVGAIFAGIQRSTDTNEWARSGTTETTTALQVAEMVSAYSTSIHEEAVRLGLAAFSMDGDFQRQVGWVVAWIEAAP